VGLKGILLQELENVLKLITAADNRVKTIPKANSIFRMTCGDAISFTLYGAQLTCRSADRSVRKWKDRSTIELL
jgi:RNase P/RNase MRP subunit p29